MLVDQVWFKNYKLFISADMRKEHNSKIFFNYEYVTDPINQNMSQFYQQLIQVHKNDSEIAEKEFVQINNSTFQMLRRIYGTGQVVVLEGGHLRFYEEEEGEFLLEDLNLSFEEEHLLNWILQKEAEVKEECVRRLLELRGKINAVLDFHMETDLQVLRADEVPMDQRSFKKKRNILKKLLGEEM